jgi:hypothetical protein
VGGSSGGNPADAGGSAAGAAGSADGGVGCHALLCDDFEASATFDTTKWKASSGYKATDTMTLDSMAAHGQRAAHGHVAETEQGYATLTETATFPALSMDLWGRANFYVTIPVTNGHTMLISASAGTTEQLEIGVSMGHWQLTWYEPGGPEHPMITGAYPLNKWSCLEWHFTTTGSKLIELYVDGTLATSFAKGTGAANPFTTMSLGLQNHSANPPPNDVYIDDVAIGSARVGCLN